MKEDDKKITLTSLEILREQIAATRKELPFSLTINDLIDLLPHGETKIKEMVRKYDYPEADPEETIPNKKVGGRRMVPRDWFLAWYYGDSEKDASGLVQDEYKVTV